MGLYSRSVLRCLANARGKRSHKPASFVAFQDLTAVFGYDP